MDDIVAKPVKDNILHFREVGLLYEYIRRVIGCHEGPPGVKSITEIIRAATRKPSQTVDRHAFSSFHVLVRKQYCAGLTAHVIAAFHNDVSMAHGRPVAESSRCVGIVLRQGQPDTADSRPVQTARREPREFCSRSICASGGSDRVLYILGTNSHCDAHHLRIIPSSNEQLVLGLSSISSASM